MPYKKRKLSKIETAKVYSDAGIDISDANERRKAMSKFDTSQEKEWRDGIASQIYESETQDENVSALKPNVECATLGKDTIQGGLIDTEAKSPREPTLSDKDDIPVGSKTHKEV